MEVVVVILALRTARSRICPVLMLPYMMVLMRSNIAVSSADLLMQSKVFAAAGHLGVPIVPLDQASAETVVAVDLNGSVGAFGLERQIALISQLHADHPQALLLGFCSHEARSVRVAAMAAGADQVVTNGALTDAIMRLVDGASV